MENKNKKIKLKVSLSGIEFEASGYDSEEASTITRKITILIVISILLGFALKLFFF